MHLDCAVRVRLDGGLLGDLSRAADMESPHRQLRAGLADRLSGNDSDGLADVDGCAPCQVSTIAAGTGSAFAVARQNGPHDDGVDTRTFDDLDVIFLDHVARLDDDIARQGIDDIDRRAAPEDPLG